MGAGEDERDAGELRVLHGLALLEAMLHLGLLLNEVAGAIRLIRREVGELKAHNDVLDGFEVDGLQAIWQGKLEVPQVENALFGC